jgi:hypothetical protein
MEKLIHAIRQKTDILFLLLLFNAQRAAVSHYRRRIHTTRRIEQRREGKIDLLLLFNTQKGRDFRLSGEIIRNHDSAARGRN